MTCPQARRLSFSCPRGRPCRPIFRLRCSLSTMAPAEPTAKLVMSITGTTVVRSWESYLDLNWTVTVKNVGNAPSPNTVYVDIRGPGSPADWIRIDNLATLAQGFNCRIVKGL